MQQSVVGVRGACIIHVVCAGELGRQTGNNWPGWARAGSGCVMAVCACMSCMIYVYIPEDSAVTKEMYCHNVPYANAMLLGTCSLPSVAGGNLRAGYVRHSGLGLTPHHCLVNPPLRGLQVAHTWVSASLGS